MPFLSKIDARRELRKVVQEKDQDPFYPRVKDCKRWFNILNIELFDRRLDPAIKFVVRRLRGIWALYMFCEDYYPMAETQIVINNRFPNKRTFVICLAHELVHHYQYLFILPDKQYKDCTFNSDWHGKSFREWKPIFKKKGLPLSIEVKA